MDFEVLSPGTCLWGYGEQEFTPTTAYGMAGHATSGQVANGVVDPDAKLYMKTLVFDPCGDDEIVVCYMDLLSGSIALLHKVHKLMPELKNRLVLVGSHTHYGPGNYFGNGFYDGFAQTSVGNPAGRFFAPELAEHLAKSIVKTVKQARGECQFGRVAVLRSTHWGSAANRSYDAFQLNHESLNWNDPGRPGENLPANSKLDRLQKAIDPRVTTILAVDNDLKHVCAFSSVACHTTCLGPYNNFRYSADWPGIAATCFKKSAPKGATYRSAFVLSAAGDASSLDSHELPSGGGPSAGQGDALKNRRGNEIGEHVSDLVQSALPKMNAAKQSINVSLRSAWWSPTGRWARLPFVGWPVAAGAEDGHGERPFFQEGFTAPAPFFSKRFHFPKYVLAGPLLQRIFRGFFQVPPAHPICQLQIGTHLFLSAPCELTAVAGFRVESAIRWFDPSIETTSVLTSTNSYMGYITTAQEYSSQQYEGGHNLFGFDTLFHFVSGHFALRRGGTLIGKSLTPKNPPAVNDIDLDALSDATLFDEPAPETFSFVINDDGGPDAARTEAIRQLELGPVFEIKSTHQTKEEESPEEVEAIRRKREAFDRLWRVPPKEQAPAEPEGDYFGVTALFLSDKEIGNDQVLSLRYGDQTYPSEIVANSGVLGETQKDLVVAIFLIPGKPVDNQVIEFILP